MGCSAGRGAEGAGRGAERPACAAGRPFRRGRGAAADGERGACSRRGAGHRGRHRARAGHRRAAEVAGGGRPVRAPVAGRVRARRRRRPARRSALLRPCPGPPGARPAGPRAAAAAERKLRRACTSAALVQRPARARRIDAELDVFRQHLFALRRSLVAHERAARRRVLHAYMLVRRPGRPGRLGPRRAASCCRVEAARAPACVRPAALVL